MSLTFLAMNSDFYISGQSPCEIQSNVNYLFTCLLSYFDADLIQSGMCVLSLKSDRLEVR